MTGHVLRKHVHWLNRLVQCFRPMLHPLLLHCLDIQSMSVPCNHVDHNSKSGIVTLLISMLLVDCINMVLVKQHLAQFTASGWSSGGLQQRNNICKLFGRWIALNTRSCPANAWLAWRTCMS